MPNGLARCLLWLPLFLGLAPGCQALYRYQPVDVLARDAETGKSIAGAQVHLSYPLASPAYAPWDCNGTTDNTGIAHVRAAPYGDAGVLVEVHAGGYLLEEKNLAVEAVQASQPTQLVVDLFAAPRPTVELVVPVGYRGLVKATVVIKEDAVSPPGQRRFTFTVPPSGVVQVAGPPLFRRVHASEFTARFTDGTPLSRQPPLLEVGLWALRSEEGCYTFVVGTQSEYDDYRRYEIREEAGQSHPSSPGQPGGRGRHGGGRKGGQTPDDS
jgi:hypothetical protein